MLKKHGLSPSALLRINSVEGSASFVLAALGGSTYRTEYGGLRLPSLRRASFAEPPPPSHLRRATSAEVATETSYVDVKSPLIYAVARRYCLAMLAK